MSATTSLLQRGMSLIEAMIALLVLTIGLVGLGALMLTSMKNVHSSAHYSVASAVVLDLEELLWLELAEKAAVDLAALDGAGCLSDDAIGDVAEAVETEWETPAAAGGNDAWSDADRFKMPGISLTVGTTSTVPAPALDRDGDGVNDVNLKQVPVTLAWDEGRFSEGNDGETYTATITLPCRPTFL